MVTEVERLVARLEVSQRQFERQLRQASRTAQREANGIQRKFDRANKAISAGFARTGLQIRNALAIGAGALGTRQLIRYADAWTRVENQIRAAEQISGTTARTTEQLVTLANETRSGLEQTANLYARLLRVSSQVGASEAEVAQITETLSQAFKAGGAAASEQTAAVLQLSQALGSGFLQGDELRSIRENAPLVAQAIANEFETTIGGLKRLGAEGEITSARVFSAILNAQEEIQDAFAVTNPTIGEGFTALRNGFIELVAAFSEGSGAAENASLGLQNLGVFLAENATSARRLGARVAEAFNIIGEAYASLTSVFTNLGLEQAADSAGLAFGDVAFFIVETLKTVIATASGVGAAIGQAMLKGVTAVADGATAIVNAGVAAIEGLLNAVISGFNAVLRGVNSVISAANGLGANIPELSSTLAVALDRFDSPIGADSRFRESIGDAFSSAFDNTRGELDAFEDSAIGVFRRIQRAGEDATEAYDPRGDQIQPPEPPTQGDVSSRTTQQDSSGGGSERQSELEKLRETIALERRQISDKIALLGLEGLELRRLESRQKLLNEAKKRGLDLDRDYSGNGETLRQEISRQADALADLGLKYDQARGQAEFFDQQSKSLKDGMLDAAIQGENLSGVLEDVAKSFARAALESALFNSGPFALGTSGGLLGGLLGGIGIPGFANGTDFAPGGLAVVGERGPELVNLPRGSQVIPNNKIGQATGVVVEIFVRDNGALGAIARQEGARAALPVALNVVEQNNSNIPSIVSEAQARA